jgi:ribosome-associated protein YbcJ (S4-like RNA binding protein)
MIITPENAIRQRLLMSPRVIRHVGMKIFSVAVPKWASFPFIVYRRPNVGHEDSLNSPIEVPKLSIQVASWAESGDEAKEIANEVRIALNGHIATIAGCTIQSMRLVSETDDFLDPTNDGAQLPAGYETRQLYQVQWEI